MTGKVLLAAAIFALASTAHSAVVTTFYGDDDGFGVGVTSGIMNPNSSNASGGEAALTDIRLIASSFLTCGGAEPAPRCGPFNPTGMFGGFAISGPILSATLTLRTGSFDSSPALEVPNRIFLDGMLVDPSFINGFSAVASDLVETQSFALDPSFFAALSDGLVSLAGTNITEASGSGSFQVDFLRLDIVTSDGTVPEPMSLALVGTALAGLALSRRRRPTPAADSK